MKQNNNKNFNNDYFKIYQQNLYKHYSNRITSKYNLYTINNILLNSKCHLVSVFKDYLLYDDLSEFYKRYYKQKESNTRIKKISKYYKDSTIIYPNYSPLFEAKYMYSNIIKKHVLINKHENYKKKVKNNMLKKHYQEKNEIDNKKNCKNFFSSTIYNDILNESESFLSLLFGIEKKSQDNKNQIKNDNEKEMEELIKIIDIIENNEINDKNIDESIHNKTDINKKNNLENKEKITVNSLKKNSKEFINNNRSIFNHIKLYKANKNKKSFKNVIKIEKVHKNIIENNKNNEASKENNNYTNSIDTKPDITSYKKTIYHRKVNSTLIGDYLNKLELPSNSNVINMLKNANETYADNMNKNSMRSILYQTMKSTNGFELKNSTNKIIHLPKNIQNNSSKEINNTNTVTVLENKSQLIINAKKQNSRNFNKLEKFSKIIKLYKKSNFFASNNKRNSPVSLSTRNKNSLISTYENNKNSMTNNTISNGNIFNNVINDTSNSIFNTYRKPESGYKLIYVNPNFTGPYSKPKCLYKDKKYNGISAKKLFSNSNDLSNNENEKKN